MNTVGDALGQGFVVLLFMAACYGAGHVGAAAIEYAVRGLLFLRKGCPVGVATRPCVRCARAVPSLLYRRGRWMCLLCETRHPDPTVRR